MAIACLALAFVTACGSTSVTRGPSAGQSSAVEALLASHGHVTAGPTTIQPVTIGDTTDIPWLLYLEASQAVGLDFRGQEGAPAELHVTPVVGRNGPVDAIVLVREGRPIGGWLAPEPTASGVRLLTDRP